ncbi:MAG: GIY-YIG nuclease family protein [Chloroflexota bacterium]
MILFLYHLKSLVHLDKVIVFDMTQSTMYDLRLSSYSFASFRGTTLPKHNYYVYILTNHSGTLYIGMTNDLERCLYEHKSKLNSGFTAKYNLHKLLFFEHFTNVNDAILREKQLKRWSRSKKVALIGLQNPDWHDLSLAWDDS